MNLSLGASNVSFGLPDRKSINAAYLAPRHCAWTDRAITGPDRA